MFITAYNSFRNKFVLDYSDQNLSELFEKIKKYKLASSEGINKVGNRVNRYEILYKICVEGNSEILEQLSIIAKDLDEKVQLRAKQYDRLEEDDIIDIES